MRLTPWPSPSSAPRRFEREASGWVFEGMPANRRELAIEGSPRVEAGHRYVTALVWSGGTCAEGEQARPAGWTGLGAGATVPFDDGVVGKGEEEGGTQTQTDAKRAAREAAGESAEVPGERRLAHRLVGEGADAVRSALRAARQDPERRKEARRRLAGPCER
jgi:hypothetical protein